MHANRKQHAPLLQLLCKMRVANRQGTGRTDTGGNRKTMQEVWTGIRSQFQPGGILSRLRGKSQAGEESRKRKKTQSQKTGVERGRLEQKKARSNAGCERRKTGKG